MPQASRVYSARHLKSSNHATTTNFCSNYGCKIIHTPNLQLDEFIKNKYHFIMFSVYRNILSVFMC